MVRWDATVSGFWSRLGAFAGGLVVVGLFVLGLGAVLAYAAVLLARVLGHG